MIAERWGFSRTQLDEYSLASHEKAAKAQADGAFAEEIAPVTTPDGLVRADEGIRPGGTLEKLGSLKTPFTANGVITAGNAARSPTARRPCWSRPARRPASWGSPRWSASTARSWPATTR